MSTRKILAGILASALTMASLSINSFALTKDCDVVRPSKMNYSIEMEDESIFNDATLIGFDEYYVDSKHVTVKTYIKPDGTELVDTLIVNSIRSYSESGSDTVTRSLKVTALGGWLGTITITASFDWYKEGLFSYVRCSEMSTERELASYTDVSQWEESYSENYVSIGTANATVKFCMYNYYDDQQQKMGTFKITCDDTGNIKN